MLYHSTRDDSLTRTGSQALLEGLAKDGGLYVPESFPQLELDDFMDLSYQELACRILSLYFTEFSEEEISDIVKKAYGGKFDDPALAPLHFVNDQLGFLELFHGPTLAFKDMALSILPHLMRAAQEKMEDSRKRLILTATSGDTGKAAMEGFAGVDGMGVLVFYPYKGVSPIQERQMLTQPESNVRADAVKGNFDDCQKEVKKLFEDQNLAKKLEEKDIALSSANSINIGRLIPQIVYYFDGYRNWVKKDKLKKGETLNVIVPTGNFGDVLAAFYAKEMGLPLGQIAVASNDNKVLFDFAETGNYDANRKLTLTSSPSMDILVSSNLERYLYLKEGNDEKIREKMKELKEEGHFSFPKEALYLASWANEEEVSAAIREVFENANYLMDPHTAVAYASAKKLSLPGPLMIVSTASPYKFPNKILESLGKKVPDHWVDAVESISEETGLEIPKAIRNMFICETRKERVISKDEMEDEVLYASSGEGFVFGYHSILSRPLYNINRNRHS